ncbi:unnamed protein product [Ectocarpus sp. CCAP 1310/34]|nr:unnamed protein product [Ectocarpus sp. CCAP 1310/34]
MSLPLATLKELQKLAALKAKGVILERQYEVIKKHVREGNSLSSEDWEAFDLARDLRSSGVLSEEEWTTQTVEGEGDHSGEGVEDGDSSDEDTRETASGQMDELRLVDDDDSMESDNEIHAMEIPDGFRIQASTPAALDSSLLQRGLLVRLGMGWLGGIITRQSQERTRHLYDYRVHLDLDQSTRSMKLPLEMYRDPDAVVDSWILLERSTVEQVDGGGAAATLGAPTATSADDDELGTSHRTIARRALLHRTFRQSQWSGTDVRSQQK